MSSPFDKLRASGSDRDTARHRATSAGSDTVRVHRATADSDTSRIQRATSADKDIARVHGATADGDTARAEPVEARARRVKLILFDVDGVLTDGKLLLHADGSESKRYDIKDGTGIVLAQRAGLRVGFLSARMSMATQQRATQLGVTLVHQGIASKIETYDHISDELLLEDEEIAYMGDDIVDLAVLARVGLAAAPADAVPEVRARAHWVSTARGGDGAARELIELVLRAQAAWEPLLIEYMGQRV